ncbi:dipeptide epimerase, partial [Planctomycetota bacterium]
MEYKVRELKLVHTWIISRSSDDVKNNVFVRFERDGIAGIGEAAPSLRYNETPESTIETIKKTEPLFEQYDP